MLHPPIRFSFLGKLGGALAWDARRLATADRALAGRSLAIAPALNGRTCDGAIVPPSPPVEPLPANTPLTPGPQR